MNTEIYTILDDMKSRFRKDKIPIADSDKQTYLQIQASQLLVLLAEETEKSTNEMIKLNKRLLYLTWGIAVLTTVTLLVAFFEFPKVSILGNQRTYQTNKETQQNKTNEPSKTDNKTHK